MIERNTIKVLKIQLNENQRNLLDKIIDDYEYRISFYRNQLNEIKQTTELNNSHICANHNSISFKDLRKYNYL